jgi:hypothetical protein
MVIAAERVRRGLVLTCFITVLPTRVASSWQRVELSMLLVFLLNLQHSTL